MLVDAVGKHLEKEWNVQERPCPFCGEMGTPFTHHCPGLDDAVARLMEDQEPLGKEFEQVLSDNLWDLMVKNG